MSYSHVDSRAVERLKTHAVMLERDGLITSFYDRDILAGGHLDTEIFQELDASDVFLAFVSPDFLASKYCYEREMKRAIQLHEAGRIRIIPVIVEDCEWKASPLGQFKAFPTDAIPIAAWANENAAYLSIVTALREVAEASKIKDKPPPQASAPVAGKSQHATAKPAYRLKRSFDQIDRIKFREEAFRTIKSYFRESADEIARVEGVRCLFREVGEYSFTCTIINEAFGRGIAHITVHMGTEKHGMGDIFWSNQENAERNTAHGHWSIGHTEYDQHLEGGAFESFGDRERTFTAKAAAEAMWAGFIERAGISHA